jgi:putative FmdB family regulatory protein
MGRIMPRYEYACEPCQTSFDVERPIAEAGEPHPCPFCASPARRVITPPKFLFKADPLENRPVWHNHGAYGHAHAPGRGFHGRGTGESSE